MQKENGNVIIKKGCHSRGMLSGISLIRLREVVKNFCSKTTKQKEDPQQKPVGMTPYFTTARAFTLIELLVVILIIGILAAVAVPQYRVAVAKAHYAELVTLGEELHHAEEIYYLANGTYTDDLSKLDIEMPQKTTVTQWWFPPAGRPSVNIELTDSSGLAYGRYLDQLSGTTSIIPEGCRHCKVAVANEDNTYLRQVCKNATGSNGYRSSNGYWEYPYPGCDGH